VFDPKNVMRARKAIRRAFEYQLGGWGFSFVEVLAACPTNWKLSPVEAAKRVATEMVAYYPLGTFKDAHS